MGDRKGTKSVELSGSEMVAVTVVHLAECSAWYLVEKKGPTKVATKAASKGERMALHQAGM